MKYKNLILQNDGKILTIILNRALQMNALNRETVTELESVMTKSQRDENISAIIITGAGEKAFASGADIKEFVGMSEVEGMNLAIFGQRVFRGIEESVKPVLAAVNGYALGGGCELAMACHLRVASVNAVFGQPEAKLGIIAGYGGTQRLIQYVGKAKAIELHMTGRNFSAQEALEMGLVNYVVPETDLMKKSQELLEEIIVNSPKSIESIIKSVNAYFDPGMAAFENEAAYFAKCFLTNDSKEGVSAFLEKRKPLFKGN